MKTNVTKVTLWVVDHDNLGEDQIKDILEGTRYPNHCISPYVRSTETKSVEWHDRHPLNVHRHTAAFDELFGGPLSPPQAPETQDQETDVPFGDGGTLSPPQAPETQGRETGGSSLPTALFDPDATPQWTITPKPVYAMVRLRDGILAIAGEKALLLGDDSDEVMAWVEQEALKAPGPKT